MKILKDFVLENYGQKIGTTPVNMGECVGLVQAWGANLGLSWFSGNAKDLFDNAPTKEWIKTKNAKDKYPQAGDVIVWNGNMGGGYGHTALVLGSFPAHDLTVVFEQNNAGAEGGTTCEVTAYSGSSWNNCIGWLTPKVSFEVPGIQITDDIPSDIEDLLSLKDFDWYSKYWTFEDFFQDSIVTHEELNNQKAQYKTLESNYEVMDSQYNAQLKAKTNEIYEKNTHIAELEQALSALKEAAQHNLTPLNLKNDKGYVYATKDLLASLVERLTAIFK